MESISSPSPHRPLLPKHYLNRKCYLSLLLFVFLRLIKYFFRSPPTMVVLDDIIVNGLPPNSLAVVCHSVTPTSLVFLLCCRVVHCRRSPKRLLPSFRPPQGRQVSLLQRCFRALRVFCARLLEFVALFFLAPSAHMSYLIFLGTKKSPLQGEPSLWCTESFYALILFSCSVGLLILASSRILVFWPAVFQRSLPGI